MNVKLVAHTSLSYEFLDSIEYGVFEHIGGANERAALALTAIRTCYSPNRPTEIIAKEGEKYFGREATDGEGGTDADRLFRHITRSGHTSTLEHITYTFAVEDVSRSLLAQITRHRHFSFSVQSQRYVRMASGDKSGGYKWVVPESIKKNERLFNHDEFFKGATAEQAYIYMMQLMQNVYDAMREAGVPAEDARFVLPNAAATNFVMTGNLRSVLEFYQKRRKGKGAQWEIAELAERIREEIVNVDPWTEKFFEEVAK